MTTNGKARIVELPAKQFLDNELMERIHTKETAEALLRELPSVLGAFVREDINGHPREIHLLIAPGPSVKLLAQDVRDMLEEKLGVPIDHRIISIAQLAEDHADFGVPGGLEALTEPAEPPEARPRFLGVEAQVREQRVRVRAQLQYAQALFEGEAAELDVGPGRARAAALATLRAASAAAGDEVRLELESVSLMKAFDRDYVIVSVLAGAPMFGRTLRHLAGAQPIEHDVETAAALAALKAINRVVAKLL